MMLEFAVWAIAATFICVAASGIFFIVAPPQRTSLWSVLGVITGMTAVGLGVILAILGLDVIIRTVAMSMGF